jgi:hypothetical protein
LRAPTRISEFIKFRPHKSPGSNPFWSVKSFSVVFLRRVINSFSQVSLTIFNLLSLCAAHNFSLLQNFFAENGNRQEGEGEEEQEENLLSVVIWRFSFFGGDFLFSVFCFFFVFFFFYLEKMKRKTKIESILNWYDIFSFLGFLYNENSPQLSYEVAVGTQKSGFYELLVSIVCFLALSQQPNWAFSCRDLN